MKGSDRSIIRAIRGPVTLITIGALFALNNFTEYHFEQTWPVILIVFGLLSLLGRSLERAVPIPPRPPNPPVWNVPPPPPSPAGGYAGSSYAQSPSGAAKCGDGSTGPPPRDTGEGSGGNVLWALPAPC